MRELGFIILFLIAASCGSHKQIPLQDKTKKASSLTITVGMDIQSMSGDAVHYSDIIDFVDQREDNWGQPLGTFPSPQITVSFLDSTNQLLFPLWVGPNWIGTRYRNQSYLRNISESESDSLKKFLGQ